jgi:hypothetical protein
VAPRLDGLSTGRVSAQVGCKPALIRNVTITGTIRISRFAACNVSVQGRRRLVRGCGIALRWRIRTWTWPTFTGSGKMTILR